MATLGHIRGMGPLATSSRVAGTQETVGGMEQPEVAEGYGLPALPLPAGRRPFISRRFAPTLWNRDQGSEKFTLNPVPPLTPLRGWRSSGTETRGG